MQRKFACLTIVAVLMSAMTTSQTLIAEDDYLCISGVYPHLTAYNQVPTAIGSTTHGEAGIGAVVPWAGKLWYLTYPQHQTRGSNDKLYMVDGEMNLTIRPESLGGTHANRMIHAPSNQLMMGYYVIDADGNVRTFDPQKLVGRMTATMQHLKDPANMVYFFDMEGAIYEADVNTLEVNRLFSKPFPGWHGKGAYTAQGRVVFSNNGERETKLKNLLVGDNAKSLDEAGVLCQWAGDPTGAAGSFEIIDRKQFTDVTGPDGIAPTAESMDKPLWAMGWDRRSVIVKLLDDGLWHTFRMPKASHSFDHRHGWYTEWPRIREIVPGDDPVLLMCMHGGMYDFPETFSAIDSSGIRPITTHLRYVPDFCGWNGRVVISGDESSMMDNPRCGQAQSNLWFGTLDQLQRFGPQFGVGGVWQSDEVQAGVPSDPYLFAGYKQKTLHLKASPGAEFVLQVDKRGDGNWTSLTGLDCTVGDSGYRSLLFDDTTEAEWIRLVPKQDGTATAYFHYLSPRESRTDEQAEFDSLADITSDGPVNEGVIRPAAHNRSLQWLYKKQYGGESSYIELDLDPEQKGRFRFTEMEPDSDADRSEEVKTLCGRSNRGFTVDEASVVVTMKDGSRYRLPKGDAAFDTAMLRSTREVQSERWLADIHGTFYEMPRASDNHSPDFERMKPVASHSKRIGDFCTWRGLLCMTGTRTDADPADPHYYSDASGRGLWMGQVDDLWKLGKPTGHGGPWMNTEVQAGELSDPYLMTGYDRKQVSLSHDSSEEVTFTIEIDFDHTGFVEYKRNTVPAGETVSFSFAPDFNAHWLRVVVDKPCQATVQCDYQ